MKTISVLPLALLSGRALSILSCTVVAPTLTKRLCEADSCPAYDAVAAGTILHAACRADCSTDDDPWLKLYDGTFVRANSAAVTGCRYSYQPYSVLGLARCHEQAGAAKPASCAASALKPVRPDPQAAELAVLTRCNQTSAAAPPQRRLVRSRVFAPRYVNGTFSAARPANITNGSVHARGETNSTAETSAHDNNNTTSVEPSSPPVHVIRRAPFPMLNSTLSASNTTLYVRGVNVTLNPVTARAHGAVLPRDLSYLNTNTSGSTTSEAHGGLRARNETASSAGSAAESTRFANGTFAGSGGAARRPPVVRRLATFL